MRSYKLNTLSEMKEKLLMKFKLPMINNISQVNEILVMGYRKTGNKFSVAFNGSKGYLSNIEISCEGYQKENNRIFVENLRNKDGSLKSIMVNIFYSDKNGIRLSTGKDEPKVIQSIEEESQLKIKRCICRRPNYGQGEHVCRSCGGEI